MMLRNGIPLPPTLHGGVVAMAKGTSEWSDAATLSDDGLMAGHVRYVRQDRTSVNDVDNVRAKIDIVRMTRQKTGESLMALKKRSGMSLEAIALGAGYKGRSSVQNFFSAAYEKPLDIEAATKIAQAFDGKGTPPIERADVMVLTGAFDSNATVFKLEGAPAASMSRDLPVYGTSLGAPREFDGKAVEQTMLNTGSVIEYRARPVVLQGQRFTYGLYVQGMSMVPRFGDGEVVFASDSRHSRPAQIGDDVIVYVLDPDHENDDGESACAVLVKRLVRRTATYVELEQFNPACTFKIDRQLVRRIDRVFPWGELLS